MRLRDIALFCAFLFSSLAAAAAPVSTYNPRETFAPLAAKLGEVPVRFEPRLYEASAERLLAVAREAEPGVAGLLMIGHNPGFQELARMLVGYGDRYAFVRQAERLGSLRKGPKRGRVGRRATGR